MQENKWLCLHKERLALTLMELRYKIVARFTKLPAATACTFVSIERNFLMKSNISNK